MADLPVATEPGHLSSEWLTAALRNDGALPADCAIRGFTHEAVGTGQMCNSYRLFLEYDSACDAPATIVAKLPSDDEGSRAAGLGFQVYRVEVSFYRELAEELEIRTPHCYFAEIDQNNVDFVLLLEDLAPARPGDQLAGCGLSHAELAVTEAAKLHAPLIGDGRVDALRWLNRESQGEVSQEQRGSLVAMLYPGFRERYEATIDEPILDMGARFMAKLGSYRNAGRGPWTAAHTDYRLDNMLFATEEGGPAIAIVDWQTTSRGNPMGDIAYFVGSALEPGERRRSERDLVRLYWEEMRARGVLDYGFDDCWRDYRLYSFAGFHMAVLASMLVQRTERGDEMFRVMAVRHGQQILDLDAEALLA